MGDQDEAYYQRMSPRIVAKWAKYYTYFIVQIQAQMRKIEDHMDPQGAENQVQMGSKNMI